VKEMLTVLIVDDEKTTREFLVEYIPWIELGFSQVNQAEDGEKAYDIALKTDPDLILTDIMMPKMNGIELIRQARDAIPNCKAIFLSAYSDKSFLKAAIKLQAIDYVDKPIEIDELIDIIKKTVATINSENKINEYETGKGKLIKELCKENFDLQFQFDLLKKYNFQHYKFYTVLIIKALSENQIQVAIEIIRKQFKNDKSALISTCLNDRKLDVVAILGTLCDRQTVVDKLNTYYQICKHNQLHIFTTVGDTVNEISQIYISYNTTTVLNNYQFYIGDTGLVIEKSDTNSKYEFDNQLVRKIYNSLNDKNQLEVQQLINDCISAIKKYQPLDLNYIRNIFFSILLVFEQYISEQNLSLSSFLNNKEDDFYLWQLVSFFETIDHFSKYIENLIQWVFTEYENIAYSDNIQEVLQFIEGNLADYNLSVSSIAEFMRMTPSYICQIFKKETGFTLNHFITSERIKTAKKLLEEKNLLLSEISTDVGYYDAKYFTKVFKKEAGMTPSEYRRKNKWKSH
jgi:two-component system response regulator YesN